MPRDLFAQTLSPTSGPPRSRWTIAGSFFAHVVAVGVLIVLPLVSTIDSPALASRLKLVVIPALPPSPPIVPPAAAPHAKTLPADINPNAAPPAATDRVTDDLPPAGSSRGVEVSGWTGPVGRGAPDLLPGPGVVSLAPPPPKAVVPVRPGGDIKPPQRVSYAAPVYPAIAQTAKVEGAVILEAIIDEAGVVRDVKVLRSIPLLDRAAMDAVSKWRYTPTRLNGVAVPIIMTVTVTFTLR